MKKFLVLWISQAFSLFGSAVVEFALAWYLTIETGSATVLATAMLVAFLPQIVLGPIIGAYVDRWNRKRTMILADLSISAVTLVLVLLFHFGLVQVWHIYAAMVLRAIGQSVHFPAMQAAMPMIVLEKDLARANGLNQMLQGAITIAGPPVGAMLLGFLLVGQVLLVDIVTAVIAVSILLPLFIPQPARSVSAERTSAVNEMLQGFRYIWSWRGLACLVVLSSLLNFFLMPAYTLLPILVRRFLEGDVLKLGWLNSAFGIGMIAGGLALGVWGGFKRRIATGLTGVIVGGAATAAIGFTTTRLFWLGLGASFLVGMGLSFGNGPILATLQATVAKDMQGRIFALLGSLSGLATPLGLALAGPLADAIGIHSIYWIGGGAVVLIGLAGFFIRPLMNLEKKEIDQEPVS